MRREWPVSVAVLVALLAAWEAASRAGIVHEFILPAPSLVAVALGRLMTAGFFAEHLGVTLYETLAGFVIGSGIAFAGGVLLHAFPRLNRVVYPYVIVFQVVPKVALAPIFVTWFGFGLTSKVVMAATISFFPTLVNTIVGLGAVEEEAVLLFRSLVAHRHQAFFKLSLPSALPYVFAGLKTSLTFAFIGAIVGEFVGANQGIGLLVETYNFQLDIPAVFALIVVLSVVGLGLYLAFEYIDRKIVFWRDADGRF
jgi:NitT/TauT family transport system permease protein